MKDNEKHLGADAAEVDGSMATSADPSAIARHTPGPWVIRECAESRLAIGVAYQWPEGQLAFASVATTPAEGIGPLREQREANAHLIAAAPELKDALVTFVDRYVAMVNSGDCGNWNPEEEDFVIAARAAIKKAEGR